MLSVAARSRESLAGKPCGIIGGKENGDAGDVVRLSDATERRARDHRLLEIATNDAAAVRAFGLDLARRNSVTRKSSRRTSCRHAPFRNSGSLGRSAGRLLLWHCAQLSANAILPRRSAAGSVVR